MTSSYTILLLFQVQIHSTIIFISQDFVNFNHDNFVVKPKNRPSQHTCLVATDTILTLGNTSNNVDTLILKLERIVFKKS